MFVLVKEVMSGSHTHDQSVVPVSLLSDRDRFQLGTLSHSLNVKTAGYQELLDWPAVAPDQSVRNVEVFEPVETPL